MSHIHIPDGILPTVIWVTSYLITLVIIFVLCKKMDGEDVRRKVPIAGVMAAIMLIAMSIPLGFIPLHFSLAVLCGILIGPGLGFIVVFVISMMLAFFGHGGITVVGLNTLIIGSEVLIGAYMFRVLLKHQRIVPRVVLATVIALLVSVSLMVAVVGTTIGVAEALPANQSNHDHQDEVGDDKYYYHEDQEVINYTLDEAVDGQKYINFTGWSAVLTILLLGIFLETFVTTLVVKYFVKVRPDLLQTKTNT
ncbi:MAG: hypothetical protein APF76_15185 [Desulfitibacter sp. BRH_c19]|nr:MAG: hypothetical protein APF76_15185 [Desulfitibacter sp. BRH_c19]